MCNIELLDCTLRDGAYITNGDFGTKVIKGILLNLVNANVNYVEVGWLKNIKYQPGSVYYNCADDVRQYLPSNQNQSIVVMMDYGRYDIENLENYDKLSFDTIRLVFPLEKYEEAIRFSFKLREKGYKICLQAANTQSYSDEQIIKLIHLANEANPISLSIVDTFGTMYSTDLNRLFMLINNNLDKNIKLGFHSHNNLQLSFSLAIEFAKLCKETKRNGIIDSSLCGMGRGAGNTCTELITNYLNNNYDANYDLNLIMDTIDIYMKNFLMNYKWGYSIPYCIAGQLGSHVNNIAYLQTTHKTKFRDMKIILESMPKSQRKAYDYDKLENLYINYLSKEIDDTDAINKLHNKFKDKDIMLIVPGSSAIKEIKKIKKELKNKDYLVVGINSFFPEYKYDYLFFANSVRYNYISEQNIEKFGLVEKIITSNIKTKTDLNNEYVINYNLLIKRGWKYFDNTTIIAIRFFEKMGAKSINFVGFDGYCSFNNDYGDKLLQIDLNEDEKQVLNNDIISMLEDFTSKNKNLPLNFLTGSKLDTLTKNYS